MTDVSYSKVALLRAACEYAGRPQDDRVSDVEWMIELHGKRFFACGLDILRPPYCDTLLGEILRRLRKDGWRVHGCSEIGWNSWSVWHLRDKISRGGSDPDHAVLAVASAMRDAGIISVDEDQ